MQTPLINHPIGINSLNGTASSTSKTMYLHGCVFIESIYTHLSTPKNLIPGFISFFSPSLKTAAESVNDEAYKGIQAL